MSDDIDSPGGAEPAPPSEEPAADASPADVQAEPTAPQAAAPAPTAPPDATPAPGEPTPEPVTAEPVTAESVVAPPAAAAVPVAATAAPPAERRSGILLPTWLAVALAILLIGGIGFAVGYWAGDDNDDSTTRSASSSQLPANRLPGLGTLPDGPRNNGGGNGTTTAQTAFLGVSVESVDNNGGARVTTVQSGSPAADAGLKTGDVITKVGDTNVQSDADLIRAIRSQDPGDDVTITYTRDGNSAQAKVTLGDRSDATRRSLPS